MDYEKVPNGSWTFALARTLLMSKKIIAVSVGILFVILTAVFYFVGDRNTSVDPDTEFADLRATDEADLFTIEQMEDGSLQVERENGPFSFVRYDEAADEICFMDTRLVDLASSEISKNGVRLSAEEMGDLLASSARGECKLTGARTSATDERIEYTRFEIHGEYEGQFTLYANHGKHVCRIPASLTNKHSLDKSITFDIELFLKAVLCAAVACLILVALLIVISIVRTKKLSDGKNKKTV